LLQQIIQAENLKELLPINKNSFNNENSTKEASLCVDRRDSAINSNVRIPNRRELNEDQDEIDFSECSNSCCDYRRNYNSLSERIQSNAAASVRNFTGKPPEDLLGASAPEGGRVPDCQRHSHGRQLCDKRQQ
jgi:hypothetical protein